MTWHYKIPFLPPFSNLAACFAQLFPCSITNLFAYTTTLFFTPTHLFNASNLTYCSRHANPVGPPSTAETETRRVTVHPAFFAHLSHPPCRNKIDTLNKTQTLCLIVTSPNHPIRSSTSAEVSIHPVFTLTRVTPCSARERESGPPMV